MTKKMKLLIAYDGSDCAEAALDDLQRAGLPSVAEALVMSVTEIWLPAPPPSTYEIVEQARAVHVPADIPRVYSKGSPAVQEAQSLAERAAARMRTNFPGWKVRTLAAVGSPGRELITKADEWRPHLAVVGSHGRTMFGRLVLGSVSQAVLTYAHCSVRVARGRLEEPGTPVRIVLGVDGSPASAAAVREVGSRIWPPMSEVRVIAVNDPLSATFVGGLIPPLARIVAATNQEDRAWLTAILEHAADQLRRSGLSISTESREGEPKRMLVEAAEAWGADCIFVGSIGFGNPFERFVLGSVSASVAARAHSSVEVVRPRKTNDGNHRKGNSEYPRN